ncbi:MnmC family methyltransferase [Helicobacter anatolicus]|uniref:MnmC family methyltransferase n=1 Tax=Helicobacter anatolicus TaxID=2905874 RepID=UPI001E337761|nr:MnmC family methyltransferase [Helicobacter anatolicus]MCE3039428.1 hypothetical protein [Helicobacter anatolicus]
MDKKLQSADGSITYYSHLFDECYHSLKDGAYNETIHKYIKPPFLFGNFSNRPLKILDICFGLGYNSFLSFEAYKNHPHLVQVIAPEIDKSVLDKIALLNYPNLTLNKKKILQQIENQCPVQLAPNFTLQVQFCDALIFIPTLQDIDIIYLDAFSQKSTPQFWNQNFFEILYKILKPDGMIMSYSTHKTIYQNAKKAGFRVYKYDNQVCRKSSIFTKNLILNNEKLEII